MTFWRLCSGIPRSFNFILCIGFKMGKHPQSTVYWVCGFIVGCALTSGNVPFLHSVAVASEQWLTV